MTNPPARSPRLLLIATVVLVVAGVILLTVPHTPSAPATSAPPRTTAPTPYPSATAARGPAAQASVSAPATASAASTQSAGASALPPHGEGVAGDAVIQKSLENAWPADLAADEEQRLLAAGRGLLRADATGIGRAKWPAIFGSQGQAIAPAFSTARFRIQAAIARRDGSRDKAVVHLVWAAADRGGTYTDRRITDWYFTRTSTKGGSTWTPQPRT
ncbi:hypothetical protein [Streptomyces capitiformicae]|uniref:Uncharacterized protein n=1 Tax=Streptomyces capitiformicae TaxID=2014920 RepID=A0A918Z200_9ACTN|nr:hypothetical protein [Streptomyces capitiformicae]GHE34380.1 hypothetical protein GCM10017771_51980 [Streptomyces capitiformicae]